MERRIAVRYNMDSYQERTGMTMALVLVVYQEEGDGSLRGASHHSAP
jgi:hypothetical protein